MFCFGPNLGRIGDLGARDHPGSATKVPEPEDLHHSGDNPEDAKAASGARQPAARGSQRCDVSTNTIPSEPDIAIIALQQPGTDLNAEFGNEGAQRECGEPDAGESIQGGDTTRDDSTKQAASGAEPSAASPPATRCQRMPAPLFQQGEKQRWPQLRMQPLWPPVVPAMASERDGPDLPARVHHPERSASLRPWRVVPPESPVDAPVDALLLDLFLSSRESGIGIEQSTLRRGRCSTDGASVTDAAPDGQPATFSATETLRPGGQPAAPGVTAVAAVQLFQGVTAPGSDSSRGSNSSRAASGTRSDSSRGSDSSRAASGARSDSATLSAPQGAERHDRGDSFQLAVHQNAHVYVTVRLYGRLYGVRRM